MSQLFDRPLDLGPISTAPSTLTTSSTLSSLSPITAVPSVPVSLSSIAAPSTSANLPPINAVPSASTGLPSSIGGSASTGLPSVIAAPLAEPSRSFTPGALPFDPTPPPAISATILPPAVTYVAPPPYTPTYYQPYVEPGAAAQPQPVYKGVMYEVGRPPYTTLVLNGQYDYGRIILIVIFIVILAIAIVLLILTVYSYFKMKPPSPKPEPRPSPVPIVDQDVGASVNGSAVYHNGEALTNAEVCTALHAAWSAGSGVCSCLMPFFGPECNRQAHDATYYGLGEVSNPADLVYVKEQLPPANGFMLSFGLAGKPDPNSCTSQCDRREDCFGVEYVNDQCALILSNPELVGGATVTVNPNIDPAVYLYRQGVRPVVKDRVFGYSGVRPLRFWAVRPPVPLGGDTPVGAAPAGVTPALLPPEGPLPGEPDVYSFMVNQLNRIGNAPERVVNDGRLVGVWSLQPFTETDFARLLRGGPGVYVDSAMGTSSDYPLNIPPSMRGKPLYVMYGVRPPGLPMGPPLMAYN